MSQKTDKKKHYDPLRYARMLRTAKITGVSPRQVRRVCDGEQNNDVIMDTIIRMAQYEDHFDNELLKEVKKLVP